MRDLSFIRIDPKTRKVTFGLFPEIISGPQKFVQEIYLKLVAKMSPFLRANRAADSSNIMKAINDAETEIKQAQLQAEVLPEKNERLSKIIVNRVQFVENTVELELTIVAESAATTTLNFNLQR